MNIFGFFFNFVGCDKIPPAFSIHPHEKSSHRTQTPSEQPGDAAENPPEQPYNRISQGSTIKQKSQNTAENIIKPQVTLRKGGGEGGNGTCPEKQEKRILQCSHPPLVGEERPERTKQVEHHSQRSTQETAVQEQQCLFVNGQIGIRYQHQRNSFPKADSGPLRSRSPY